MKHQLTLLLALLAIAAGRVAAQQHDLTTLMPRPKEAFVLYGTFTLAAGVPIYLSNAHDPAITKCAAYLTARIAERQGFTPEIRFVEDFTATPAGPKIIIDFLDPLLKYGPRFLGLPQGGDLPGPEGYLLNVAPDAIVIAGKDADGAFNGIITLLQLMNHAGSGETVPGVHIMDYPDYPIRWIFSQHNLRGPGQLAGLRTIADTMAYYKLNGIQQNDFKYQVLGEQPRYYFDSVDTFKGIAARSNLEIIPGVAAIGYSDGILWHDPNLAEGFPASASYVIEGDTGRLIPDPGVSLPNGSFESIGGNGKFTGWSFYDDSAVTADHAIVHGGSSSARCENFTAGNPSGNCRFNRRADCQPNRYYHLSAWVRTESLRGTVQLLAIGTDDGGGSRTLTFTQYGMNGTNGWTKVETFFNTLEFNHLLLYAGVWGGEAGRIWWDDFAIEDAGLMNVLRRPGTPLSIRKKGSGALCREGSDFAPIADTVMGSDHGYYGFHAPPTLRRRPGGALANGDTVTVSYFHPLTTVSDESSHGSVMACISEDTLYAILAEQIAGVESIYHNYPELSMKPAPARFFLGHDEIRSMNRDSACMERGMSPAALLADNLKRTAGIVGKVHPGAQTFVWSDMFDSLHNAYKDYYLINGDLAGDWDSIPRSTVIVNWNGGRRDASLRFFAAHGFSQITSPYYDAGNNDGIRAWRLSMERVPNILGMMYTTWSGDYEHLAPFAYYAWGAGPYIIHTPVPASGTSPDQDQLCFFATVLPDPYDPTDAITSVTVHIYRDDGEEEFPLDRTGASDKYYGCTTTFGPFQYEIVATNEEGLTRSTPRYTLYAGTSGVGSPEIPPAIALAAYPNPASSATMLDFTAPHAGEYELTITDPLGRAVAARGGECGNGLNRIGIDLAGMASGLYRCEIRSGGRGGTTMLRVVR